MGSVADSVAAKIRIIFDNTNFLTRKITQKWFSWTYLYLIMLNQTLKLRFVRQIKSFSKQNYYLCSVYTHTGSLDGQRLGRHTYGKRRFCTLWFWRYKNLANSTTSQEQSNKERLMRCIIYSPHWLRAILSFVVNSAFYILTLAWGFRRCISVVHSKTILLICYLLDYQ